VSKRTRAIAEGFIFSKHWCRVRKKIALMVKKTGLLRKERGSSRHPPRLILFAAIAGF
jgi:hypothetical protein